MNLKHGGLNKGYQVLIVGAGLIGTSIGLKLRREGLNITLKDTNSASLALARDLVGINNQSKEPSTKFHVVIVATPAGEAFEVIKEEYELHPQSMFIDVTGIKSNLINEIERLSELSSNFCSVHPMAGREVAGPQSARADLFEGRPWLITRTKNSSPEVVNFSRALGESLGGAPFEIGAKEHDELIAGISHLPQILSSVLGKSMIEIDSTLLQFAGQGLRDVSRLADSNSSLWSELLVGNSAALLPKLKNVIADLNDLKFALEVHDSDAVAKFLMAGKQGRASIPGKHGGTSRDYEFLPIVVADKPGQLAAIFEECAAISVNIEDLEIEHSPGQETGLITLALSKDDAEKLRVHLQSKGWLAHPTRG